MVENTIQIDLLWYDLLTFPFPFKFLHLSYFFSFNSSPREASIHVVKLINSRDPYVAVNALSLLDVLVKNCGYPFHLQISRKEFLNALVKRFPERPPARYSKPQRIILSYIEEWTQTLCKNSKYKDDLGFIRDMHRLLA